MAPQALFGRSLFPANPPEGEAMDWASTKLETSDEIHFKTSATGRSLSAARTCWRLVGSARLPNVLAKALLAEEETRWSLAVWTAEVVSCP